MQGLSETVTDCPGMRRASQKLTVGPGDKGSLWPEQERACALKPQQLYAEKAQLTGGDEEEPGSATKQPF